MIDLLNHETKSIEYKQEIPNNHDKFLKDIIAFSNTCGGKVVIGIVDDTREVVGVDNVTAFKLMDSISNMISDSCTPMIEPDITLQTIQMKSVIVVEVYPGKFRPYYLKSKGKETTSYVRINGTSRPADATKLKELELEGKKISYDSMQCIGVDYNKNTAWELCREMKRVALNTCTTEEERAAVKDISPSNLETMDIIKKVGSQICVTNAFALLTENIFKQARIKCALFKGTTRDIFIDKKTFTGGICEQIEDAYQFVLKHINLGASIEGLYRKDEYEIPISAIREVIVNAVTHRSYLDESNIQISIFDDRIEVLSPGMLYDGLDIESVKSGKSKCRNKAIAEAFSYMKIIEEWGTGIPRIIERCKACGLKEPLFEEFGDGFKVTLFRNVENKKLVSTEQLLDSTAQKVVSADQNTDSTAQKVVSADQNTDSTAQKVVSADPNSNFTVYKLLLIEKGISSIYVKNIEAFYKSLGLNRVFKQSDIMVTLKCSKTKASNIISNMKKADIIEKIAGYGNGGYRFREF